MKHTLSVLVEDKPGALSRISNLFARRGYNIESLAVGQTEREGVSRITLRVDCAEHSLEQITKQIRRRRSRRARDRSLHRRGSTRQAR